MTEPKTIEVTVYDSENPNGQWIPERQEDAIAWLSAKLDEIPENCREAANLEIDSDTDWDGGTRSIIAIKYSRPESPEEIANRIANEGAEASSRERLKKQRELAALRRLQAKYAGEVA